MDLTCSAVSRMSYLLVTGLISADPESELFLLRADNCSLGGHQRSLGIVQQHCERVFEPSRVVLSLCPDESSHLVWLSEQVVCLVEQVRAQVIDGTTRGNDLCLPGGRVSGDFGTMTVEVSFVFDDTAQSPVLDELRSSDEVRVPAAVCKDSPLERT